MPIRLKAGIDVLNGHEGAHQQAGANEQHDPERDLHDDQAARVRASSEPTHTLPVALERR